MKKIILALDAAQINTKTIDFACYIARLTDSKLTGIFLENFAGRELSVMKNSRGSQYAHVVLETEISENDRHATLCELNLHLFQEACKKQYVNCSMHLDRGVPIEEIIIESRFADLVIVDPEISFRKKDEKLPTGFVKDLLVRSVCPVVIAPSNPQDIDEILFAYDGKPSSLFAIKQFTYLFPEFSGKKITIVRVIEKGDSAAINNCPVRELLQIHYPQIEFMFLHGKAGEQLFQYLAFRKNTFVVMGAFGRTMLSTFFRRSTAELVIKANNVPVFIAHY